MIHLINFIKLIRPINLLIIVLIQCLIKYLLINYFIDLPALSNFNFLLLVTSTVLITAGGYIINDIYDVDVDKINKNKSRIINKKLSARIAIFWYFFLNIFFFNHWSVQSVFYSSKKITYGVYKS